MTLSSGLVKDGMIESDKDLVAQFLAKNKVTVLPPVALTGCELARHERERLTKLRRDFRNKLEEKRQKK